MIEVINMFELEFNTDSVCFDTDYNMKQETARILRELADIIEGVQTTDPYGLYTGKITDYNRNVIGKWRLE